MKPEKLNRLEMRVDDAFLKAIDDWRRHQVDLPNRSEAIRRLVQLALKRSPKAKRRKWKWTA
jgi:metal-responsive CopG/Arc/MetJ family transcriptional regulator